MKIVIDIDEKDYKRYKDYPMCYPEGIFKIVGNGTPLPKGHGRLIDADELKKHKYHDNDRFENAVAVAQIDWADTIIEAESEDQT